MKTLLLLTCLLLASTMCSQIDQPHLRVSKKTTDMIKSGDKDYRESRLWFIEMYKVSRMGLFINQSMVTLQGGGYTASRICLDSASTIVESRMYNQIPLSPIQILGDAVLCKCDTLPGYYLVTNNTKWFMKNESNFDNYGFDPAKVVKVDQSYLKLFPLAYYF